MSPEQLEALRQAELACVCKHCGRCVLAGPPCCQGMRDDIDSGVAGMTDEEIQLAQERKEEKRQRRLARRAARRAVKEKPPLA